MRIRVRIGDPGLRETAEALAALAGLFPPPEEPDGGDDAALLLTDDPAEARKSAPGDAALLFLPAPPSPGEAAELTERLGDRWAAFLPPPDYREICAALIRLSASPPAEGSAADAGEAAPADAGVPADPGGPGEAVFRPADGMLAWGDRTVRLTPREAALFQTLLRHGDGGVSRREIAEEAWGGSGGRSNAADVYAGYLREKLKPLFGEGVLLSVRGVGYRLRLPCPVRVEG